MYYMYEVEKALLKKCAVFFYHSVISAVGIRRRQSQHKMFALHHQVIYLDVIFVTDQKSVVIHSHLQLKSLVWVSAKDASYIQYT